MQRPHDFGTSGLSFAKRVFIHSGVMGRISRHGVHGNGSRKITIEEVAVEGFEVTAVSLNGVRDLWVRDCTASSRSDVPVKGTFSAARFIYDKLRGLDEAGTRTTLSVRGETRTSRGVIADL